MAGNLYDHVVSVGNWGAEFRCTPLIIDVFKQRKIFFEFEHTCTGQEGLRFAKEVELEPYVSFHSFAPFWTMGAFSYSYSTWCGNVRIGRYCSIAGCNTELKDRHPIEWATTSLLTYYGLRKNLWRSWVEAAHRDFNTGIKGDIQPPKPLADIDIAIGHDVWMGEDIFLAQQVKIGTGAAIAAGAVVTRDVEPYMIVGGVPARVIRPRFDEKLIEKLLASRWWEFGPDILKVCDYMNPEAFVDHVLKVREEKTLAPFCPEKITFRHILNDLMDRI